VQPKGWNGRNKSRRVKNDLRICLGGKGTEPRGTAIIIWPGALPGRAWRTGPRDRCPRRRVAVAGTTSWGVMVNGPRPLSEQRRSCDRSISNYQLLGLAAHAWLETALSHASFSPHWCLWLPRAPPGTLLETPSELKFFGLLLPGRLP